MRVGVGRTLLPALLTWTRGCNPVHGFEREQFAWRPIQTKFKGDGQQCPPNTVSGFARLLPVIYTSSSLSKRLRPSGAAIFHAQAHIPAQPSSPLEDARISNADEDQGRPRGDFAPARQGPQAGVSEARLP